MSDISLDYGFSANLILSLVLAWPGVLCGVAFGAAIGALAWNARRLSGGALGFGLGALVGWGVGLVGYFAWADSKMSIDVDYFDAVVLALERAAPGLIVGAAIGGAAWGGRRGLGATLGALAGGAISATLWFALAGG